MQRTCVSGTTHVTQFGDILSITYEMEDMTMNEQFRTWLTYLSLALFVAAVFLITAGHFWIGIVFIGAGSSISSVAAISKKKSDLPEPKNKEIE